MLFIKLKVFFFWNITIETPIYPQALGKRDYTILASLPYKLPRLELPTNL